MMSRVTFSLFVVLLLVYHYTAEGSELTFWDGANFTGNAAQVRRTFMGQTCYNNYIAKASSITWKDLPTTGLFDGKSKIAFYSNPFCLGVTRAWFTTEKDFPADLALNKLKDTVRSFMLWQTSKAVRAYKY
ncbi:unnamed protein product [Phytophthora fragariaefolia]|uniref:Unnamed protein product n=1 Tax=Phytophthora fragariaefolia TaxID=1490495 RepID=A0A9W6XFZ2_9STRA|nr:unnamed protein product [Phytophthora fragariaefolia]